jgi:hypothetical protein
MKPLRPLIFVPGVLGSILEAGGVHLWGRLRVCYAGVRIDHEGEASARDVLRAMRVVPGVYDFDVFASFERTLLAHGFVLGETWFPFAYDWRLPIAEVAGRLRDEIVRVSDRAGSNVDLIGFSTGGVAVRAAISAELASGRPLRDLAGRVANAIFAGTMQRGALDGLLCLHRGDWMAPLGRWIEPDEASGVQAAFDSMPWARSVVRDERGRDVDVDIYDIATWRRFRMGIFAGVSTSRWRFVGSHRLLPRVAPSDALVSRFERGLGSARRFQNALHASDAIEALRRVALHVIAGEGIQTATWLVTHGERAFDPMRLPRSLRDSYRYGVAGGDGLVDDASIRALPVPFSMTRIAGAKHRTLITHPAVHAAVMRVLRSAP